MSGALDATARATATRLLAKFGKPLTVTRLTEGGRNEAPTELVESTVGYVEAFTGDAFRDGSVVAGDRKVYVSAEEISFIPEAADRVTFDGEVWSVIRNLPIEGEIKILHILQVRK